MKLIFVDDSLPGISRTKFRGKWQYRDASGELITDVQEIDRLNSIGLPPAYVDEWYAPAANAHILATGFDAKGRKQYRYHPEFRAQQEERKFGTCVGFGHRLPLIRARVDQDLRRRSLSADRAIASVVKLLDTGGIRVGNETYAKQNNSFGATTLRMRHVAVKGDKLRLSFKAKSGKQRTMAVSDKGLLRFVKQVQDLPGQHLFQFLDDDGSVRPVSSTDVNDYIRDTMGGDYSAKTFRTWVASVLAFEHLHRVGADVKLREMLIEVSDRLGNTPAIARKSYVHPDLLAAATSGQALSSIKLPRSTRWMTRQERGFLDFLEGRYGQFCEKAA